MNSKKLTALAIIAAASVVIAVAITIADNQKSATVTTAATPFVQGFDFSSVATIDIAGQGSTFQLVKQGEGFIVPSKSNYPADTPSINNLINDITDINQDETMTSNVELFEDLGVADGKGRTTIKFLDAAGKEIAHAGVIIGSTQADAGGSYIRHPGQNDVYLSRNVPYLRTAALDYINKKVMDIKADQIAKVSSGSGASNFTIEKNAAGIALLNVPAGLQAKETEIQQTCDALADLSITDVHKTVEGATFDKTYVCELTDSTVYTLKVAKVDTKYFFTCQATFKEKARVQGGMVQGQKEVAKYGGQQAAKKFTDQHAGWIYEISSYIGDKMVKTFEDLSEDVPKPEAAEGETPAVPTAPVVTPKASSIPPMLRAAPPTTTGPTK